MEHGYRWSMVIDGAWLVYKERDYIKSMIIDGA